MPQRPFRDVLAAMLVVALNVRQVAVDSDVPISVANTSLLTEQY